MRMLLNSLKHFLQTIGLNGYTVIYNSDAEFHKTEVNTCKKHEFNVCIFQCMLEIDIVMFGHFNKKAGTVTKQIFIHIAD